MVSCTQIGKTRMGAKLLLGIAWCMPWSLSWWCAPVGHQTEAGFREIARMADERGVLARTKQHGDSSGPRAHTLINGSKIEYRSWEREDNLGGASVNGGIVIDEANLLTRPAHAIISTRRSASLAPICYLGNASHETSEFWVLCQRAELEGPAGGVLFRRWTWRHYARVLEGNARREYLQFLRRERKVLGTEEFERLYEGKFLRLGAGLIDLTPVSINGGDALHPRSLPFNEAWNEEGDGPICGGLDLGNKDSWTVLSLFGRKNHRLKLMLRVRHESWRTQIHKIVREASAYGRAADDGDKKRRTVTVFFDETGLGEPVGELLKAASVGTPVRFRGVVFNNDNKQSMVSALQIASEEHGISMPWIAEAISECSTLQRTALSSGVRYAAPPGFTSDIVWSLGLAVHGMTQIVQGSLI